MCVCFLDVDNVVTKVVFVFFIVLVILVFFLALLVVVTSSGGVGRCTHCGTGGGSGGAVLLSIPLVGVALLYISDGGMCHSGGCRSVLL